MPNIPVSDPLRREARREIPARSQPSTKRIEGDNDADKLKGTPIDTTAPADGQALTARNGVAVWETPAVQPAATPTGTTEHPIIGPEHSGDFEYIPGTGLNITIGPGRYHVNQTIYDRSTTAITLTDNATNYIYASITGFITKGTSGFGTGVIPLWTIITLGGAVSSVTDRRSPFRTVIVTEPNADAHIADVSDAHDASAISILDTAGDFTATEVEGALAELQSDNEAHVAAADPHTGYVREADANWIDLTDGGASTLHSHAGGSGHTIREDGTNLTARTGLNFINGVIATDDAAGDETEVNIDYATTEIDFVAASEAAGTSAKVPRGDHVHGHPASQHAAGGAIPLFAEVHYGFAPDALPTATVATGAPQGRTHVTGDNAETGIEVVTACRVAGTSITLIIEIGSTNDMDTATWSTYKSVTLGSGVKGQIDAVVTSITADRLLRLNVSAVSGTWSGITVDLRAKRPLVV